MISQTYTLRRETLELYYAEYSKYGHEKLEDLYAYLASSRDVPLEVVCNK